MKNIPLVVGNRITYKDKYLENTELCEVTKVEACNWEEIEFVEE